MERIATNLSFLDIMINKPAVIISIDIATQQAY